MNIVAARSADCEKGGVWSEGSDAERRRPRTLVTGESSLSAESRGRGMLGCRADEAANVGPEVNSRASAGKSSVGEEQRLQVSCRPQQQG